MTQATNSTPRVAHRFGDYRIVFVERENDPIPRHSTWHAVLEHLGGKDAMGNETWWEVCDIGENATCARVKPPETAEQLAVDLLQAMIALLGRT